MRDISTSGRSTSDGYEPPSDHIPTSHYIRVAKRYTPESWSLTRSGCWFQLTPSDARIPRQGWKAHVSAQLADTQTILGLVAEVCADKGTPFKFVVDPEAFQALAGKGVPRALAGKFITIYPATVERFVQLMEDLYQVLLPFRGPYVLTDRRYRDCQVLYYRYGVLNPEMAVTEAGTRRQALIGPEGEIVEDERHPYWNPPSWVRDPIASPTEAAGAPGRQRLEGRRLLKEGRYEVQRSLGFSVGGGVYQAYDRSTSRTVLLKEGRPYTALDQTGADAPQRLLKEFRILAALNDISVGPKPLDLFGSWEHTFLCTEFLYGCRLTTFLETANPRLAQVSPPTRAIEKYTQFLRTLWIEIADLLERIHGEGFLFGDLAPSNIFLLAPDFGEVRLIDFEAAVEIGVDGTTGLATPGFASASQCSGGQIGIADDCYGLGAVMLSCLWPVGGLAVLDQTAFVRTLRYGAELFGLERWVSDLLEGLLCVDAHHRPEPRVVKQALKAQPTVSSCMMDRPVSDASSALRTPMVTEGNARLRAELETAVGRVVDYILESATPRRNDRLFPSERIMFDTNPLSFAYGACGTLYTLDQLGAPLPDELVAWVLSKQLTCESYPPGLYVGLSGIAWVLGSLGLDEVALKVAKAASIHPLRSQSADLMYGEAGFGLACLYLFLRTGERSALEMALDAATSLEATAMPNPYGTHWRSADGKIRRGLLRGGSGPALFLLYLSIVTGERGYLALGESAILSECANCVGDDLGNYSIASPNGRPLVGWAAGTAGVAGVVLRYRISSDNEKFRAWWERMAPTLVVATSPAPHFFTGMAGIGNVLLDAFDGLGGPQYRLRAESLAESILQYVVGRGTSATFPGARFEQASVAVASGACGVLLFLSRLIRGSGDLGLSLDKLLAPTDSGLDVRHLRNNDPLIGRGSFSVHSSESGRPFRLKADTRFG
ncbi:MAG: class III lanthionine synthetase LanKC [Gammaproteobacteria bacterium]